MTTRFYLHSANSTEGGTLPSTEQSTKTSSGNFDAQTVNRSMDTTIGTSQASTTFVLANSQKSDNVFFIAKFISPELNQSSIAANTWTWNFAIKASSSTNVFDYPSNTVNEKIPLCCYVWRPSSGTKVGNIKDGTGQDSADLQYFDVGTNSSNPGAPTTAEWSEDGTFAGSAVSGLLAGDVIVMEAWAFIDTNNSSSTTYSFFFDGTTVTTTNGTTVSSQASFLETPETLTFNTGPITMSEISSLTYANKFITKV